MSFWDKALGMVGIQTETKSVVLSSAMQSDYLGTPSRQDGTNFRANMVTLAQYNDSSSGNALGLSAVWACVNLLAGTIGSLPLMVYRIDAAGNRVLAKDHPLYYILHDSPNFDQTRVDFWEFLSAGIELHGNAFADIRRRASGEISSLIPIRPDIVQVSRNDAGQLEYKWQENRKIITRSNKDVLHVRGFGGNPLGGASTLSSCRSVFDGAINVNSAANNMFRNGATPSGILSTEKTLTPDQRKLAEELLQDKFAGAMNAGRPMLLDNAVKWEQLTISPEDAQMLETKKFSGEEICRIFGVPPSMVGYGDKASNWGTGLEQQVLGFQKFSLSRRLKRIEQALEKQLLSPADKTAGVTIEFSLEGLLRGDSAARASFYNAGLSNGWLNVNQVAAWENLPPVEGGDVNRVQMQNVPLTEAGSEPDA